MPLFRTLMLITAGIAASVLPLLAQSTLSWEALSGPNGIANFRIFCVDSAGTIWGGENFGRLFRSTDDGSSWSRSRLLTIPLGASVAWNGDVLVLDHDNYIWRSSNGDDNWERLPTPVTSWDEAIEDVYLSSDGTYYGCEYNINLDAADIRHSTDNGQTWQSIGTISPVYYETKVRFLESSEHLFLVHSNHISRIDNGALFSDTYPLPATKYRYEWNQTALGPEDLLYLLTERGPVRSTDLGRSWDDVTWNEYLGENANQIPLSTLWIKNGSKLMVSRDSGTTWELTLFAETDSWVRTPAGTVISARGSRLLRSIDDGKTWTHDIEGLTATTYSTPVSTGPSGRLAYGTYASGMSLSDDNGNSWRTITAVDTVNSLPISQLQDLVYGPSGAMLIATEAGIYRSNDNGKTWEKTGLQAFDVNEIEAGGDYILTAGTRRPAGGAVQTWLFGSDDFGATWDTLSKNMPVTELRYNAIMDRFIARHSNSGYIVLAKGNGIPERGIAVGENDSRVIGLEIGRQTGNLYAVIGSTGTPIPVSVRESTDGGLTWTTYSAGLSAVRTINAFIAASSGDLFLIANDNMAFTLPHGDSTWQSMTVTGSQFTSLWGALYTPGGLIELADGRLLIEIPFDGLYTTASSVLAVSGRNETGPVTFVSAYPNPNHDRSVTLTGLESPESIIRITMVDVKGGVTATWDRGEWTFSTESVSLRLPSLSPGTYFLGLDRKDGGSSSARLIVGDSR